MRKPSPEKGGTHGRIENLTNVQLNSEGKLAEETMKQSSRGKTVIIRSTLWSAFQRNRETNREAYRVQRN